MITDRIGWHKVLFPINYKNYNFREKKSQACERKGKLICIRRLPKEALIVKSRSERKKERKPQCRSLYTVSVVIETKVVIGWFKLQLFTEGEAFILRVWSE